MKFFSDPELISAALAPSLGYTSMLQRENVPERSHIITTTSAASSGPCRVAMGYS